MGYFTAAVRGSICAILSVLMTGCTSTLTKEVGKLGFQRFSPPRNSILPGTLLSPDQVGDGTVAVDLICLSENAFPGLPQPITNKSLTIDISKKLEKALKLEAGYMDKIKGDIAFSNVMDIRLIITNVTVLEQPGEYFEKHEANRTQSCTARRQKYLDGGRDVQTVEQSLLATITYKVVARKSVSGSVSIPPEVLDGLKVALGGSYVDATTSTITGENLIWGYRAERFGKRKIFGATGAVEVPLPKLTNEERRRTTLYPGELREPTE